MTSGVLLMVRRTCSICPIFSLADVPGPCLAWLVRSSKGGVSEGNRKGRLLIAALPGDQSGFREVVCPLLKGSEDDPNVGHVFAQPLPILPHQSGASSCSSKDMSQPRQDRHALFEGSEFRSRE